MHENALKEIRKFRKDINVYLDKAEEDVISELNHSKSENEKRLHKLMEDCEGISAKIKDLKQTLDSRVCQGSELFICAVNCKSDVRDTEHAVAQLQSDQQLKTFTFVPDEQLLKTVASERKLGCLDVPAIENRTLTSKLRSQKPAEQKNKSKQAVKKKEVPDFNSHAEFVGAHSSSDFTYSKQKNDDIVFETFYHRSGKEFQCIYQSGMRFYLDHWGSKEWKPFPKRWYDEGSLITSTICAVNCKSDVRDTEHAR